MINKIIFVITGLKLTNCDNNLPSSPEVFYGGFKPMTVISEPVTSSDNRRSSKIEARNINFGDGYQSYSKAKTPRIYKFREGDAHNKRKHPNFRRGKHFSFHKNSKPSFPLCKFSKFQTIPIITYFKW